MCRFYLEIAVAPMTKGGISYEQGYLAWLVTEPANKLSRAGAGAAVAAAATAARC